VYLLQVASLCLSQRIPVHPCLLCARIPSVGRAFYTSIYSNVFQLRFERGASNSVSKMPNTRKSMGTVRPYRPRKKKFNYNLDKIEAETEYASTSAKKIKDASYDDIEIDVGHNNVIINFLTVFNFLSQCLKCKKCEGDVTFSRTCGRGLGFNLVIKCKCNDQQRVSSSPLVNGAYEINRRLMFVMRILGLGLRSINTFCSLMELSSGFANGTMHLSLICLRQQRVHSKLFNIKRLLKKDRRTRRREMKKHI